MATSIVKCVKSGGVQVLLLVVGLPVVQLRMNREHLFDYIIFYILLLVQTIIQQRNSVRTGSVCLLDTRHFYLTGPSVSEDSSDINRGVCHNGVVVEFLLALSFVLNLSTTTKKWCLC